MRGTYDHIQPNMIMSDIQFPDGYIYAKNLKYQLIPFKKCINVLIFEEKKQRKTILDEFWGFFPNLIIFLKNASLSVFDPWDPLASFLTS